MGKPWFSAATLDSGIRVLTAPLESPSVTVIFITKVGSKNEAPRQAGISHFLEHFVFQGTQKYGNSRDVMRALDSVGASHNAATSKESTCFWVKASTSHLERAVELIGEIVFRPKLPEKLIKKEKGTIIQEIAMYDDHPMMKVANRFEELIFGSKTPLGREIIGTHETVSSLTRQQLVDYRRRWYRPETTIFAVTGGVKHQDVIQSTQKHFSSFSDLASPRPLKIPGSPKTDRFRLIDFKKTDQVHLVIGVPALKRNDRRRYTLGVLSTILGGNASSQLFEEVREKRGWAYYIKTAPVRYEEAGYLAVRAGVPPKKTREAVELIEKQVVEFKFSQEELKEAKEYLKGQLALEWENSQTIASHLAEDWLFESFDGTQDKSRVRSFETIVNEINRVKRDQVEKLARELLADPGQIRLAAIGPVDKALRLKTG